MYIYITNILFPVKVSSGCKNHMHFRLLQHLFFDALQDLQFPASQRPGCVQESHSALSETSCKNFRSMAGQANFRLGPAPLVQLFLQLKLFFFLGTRHTLKTAFEKTAFHASAHTSKGAAKHLFFISHSVASA